MDFIFSNTKKRSLLLVVRSFFGRFFKDIRPEQLEEPIIHARALGMSFRLFHLALKEELFNEEILKDVPLKLVSGTINEVSGMICLGATDGRSLELEGIDLTFELVNKNANPSRENSDNSNPISSQPQSLRRGEGAQGSALYSSLLAGDFSRERIASEVLVEPDVISEDAAAQRIDEGIDALASTIKGLIHSLRGRVRHVTVKLRVPYDDTAEVKNPPDNETSEVKRYHEVMLHLKGDIELADETRPDSFGNSFRKRVRFSGLRVAVYESTTGHAEESHDEEEDVHVVKLEDCIASGDLESMENEIFIEHIDCARAGGAATRPASPATTSNAPASSFKTRVVLKQLHALVSPKQLARISTILAAFGSTVPQSSNTDDASAAIGSTTTTNSSSSRLHVQVGSISLCCLNGEYLDCRRAAWQAFPHQNFHQSLKTPFYSVHTGGFGLQVCSGIAPSDQSDDRHWELFRTFGARYMSLKLDFLEVVERRPNVEPTQLLVIRNQPPSPLHATMSRASEAAAVAVLPPPLRLVLRTTLPKSLRDLSAVTDVAVLQSTGLVSQSEHSLVVRQDLLVSLGHISVNCDVETLDRVLEFYNIVDAHVFQATSAARTSQQHNKRREEDASEDEMFSTLSSFRRLDISEITHEEGSHIRKSREDESSGASVTKKLHQQSSSAVVFISSTSLELDALSLSMAFPTHRSPNIDVYGPLTQRLFSELLARASIGIEQAAFDMATSLQDEMPVMPSDSLFLSKRLVLAVEDVRVDIPTGVPNLFMGNIGSMRCDLVDKFEGTSATLFEATFETMDEQHRRGIDELRKCMTLVGVSTSNERNGTSSRPSFILSLQEKATDEKQNRRPLSERWQKLVTLSPDISEMEFLTAEDGILLDIPMALSLRVKHVDVSFHQDEMLLLLFLCDQIVECVSLAIETHAALLAHVEHENNTAVLVEEAKHLESRPSEDFATPCASPRGKSGIQESVRDLPATAIREFMRSATKMASSRIATSARDCSAGLASKFFFSAVEEGSSQATSLWGSRKSHTFVSEASTVGVHVSLLHATATLHAPRLNPNGVPVGEPLHMLLPLAERYEEVDLLRPKWMYHTYILEVRNTALTTVNVSVDAATTMHMNIRVERIEVSERLCPLPPNFVAPPTFGFQPPWGSVIPLFQGYGDLYNRSHHIRVPLARQAFLMNMIKVRDSKKMSQESSVSVTADRCCVHHQAAHEGDHWLMVLTNFVLDNPVVPSPATADGQPQQQQPSSPAPNVATTVNDVEGSSLIPCPLICSTNVVVKSLEFMVQYQPLGRDSRLLLLVPNASVDVGPITNDPKMVIRMRTDRISAFVHSHFDEDVLYPTGGKSRVDPFGRTRRGLSADLEALGFVQVLCAGSIDPTADNVTVRIMDVPDKPVSVSVRGLKLELSCAYDSFYFFRLIQSHFAAGADLAMIPAPSRFVTAFSPRFDITLANTFSSRRSEVSSISAATTSVSSATGPIVRILVNDFTSRMEDLLNTHLQRDERIRTSTSAPSASTQPIAQNAVGTDAATDMGRESTFDDFVDVSEDLDTVRHSEAAARKIPQWSIKPHSRLNPLSEQNSASSRTSSAAAAASPPPPQDEIKGTRGHFSVQGRHDIPSVTAASSIHPKKLIGCPPIAVEVHVAQCHADVKLYGGSDFGIGFASVHEDGFSETMAYFREAHDPRNPDEVESPEDEAHRRGDRNPTAPFELSLASHPPKRKVHECITLKLRYVDAQIDLFEPGKDRAVQTLVQIREVEILDHIAGSPVRTILLSTTPPELRDVDAYMFEMKWVTLTPLTSSGGVGRPEEDLSIRIEPVILTVHRKVIDLLVPFIETPDIEAPDSTMYFRRFVLHPLRLRLNVLFEVQDYHALFHGEAMELANLLPSVEDSRVSVPKIVLSSFPMADFGVRLVDSLKEQVSFDAILMLLCGVQPLRTVSEATAAAADLVLMPLEHYRRNKSLYRGIVRGLSNFSSRVGAEAMRVAGSASRNAHEILHSATAGVQQQELLSRGIQPAGVAQGFVRGTQELVDGVRGMRDIVRFCISDDGSLTQLPLALLAPVNGTMRALTQLFVGARNSVRPQAHVFEKRIYKQ